MKLKVQNSTVDSEQTSTSEISENPIEQTSVDPKSESQFSSFMSYHEGESSSLDPSTMVLPLPGSWGSVGQRKILQYLSGILVAGPEKL